MKIAICHEHIFDGDAVGNDIVGMAEVLTSLGIEVILIGENIAESISKIRRIIVDFENLDLNQFEILIYHHSTFWDKGTKLLYNFSGTIIFKYHNITPEFFFKPYSKLHYEHCLKGREQTSELLSHFPNSLWLADSEFNRLDLIDKHPELRNSKVVPPFHKQVFIPKKPQIEKKLPPKFLFVGRVAPNKGHRVLIRVFHEYLKKYKNGSLLEIIGNTESPLKDYKEELIQLSKKLGISNQICWRENLSDNEVKHSYNRASVFVCFSEHEGFCVPLVESQSMGLPVVTVDSSAIHETLGENQLIDRYPKKNHEFLFYAKVINEVLENFDLKKEVVESGYANFLSRFTFEKIADYFVESIFDSLKEYSK